MRQIQILSLVFAVLATLVTGIKAARPQSQAPGSSIESEQPYRISLDLDLVVLPVTVLDRSGGFVSGLREPDFQVYENGVRQPIRLFLHEDIPVTAGLVIDHSGSMRNKLAEVIAAAHTFVGLSNPLDQMFVVNFSDKVSLGLPAAVPFSDRASELELAIEQAPAAGETALYDAVDMALDRLKSGNREKKVLIIVSDGGDNKSHVAQGPLLKKAADSNAVIYTVGIFDADDPDQNPALLRRMAHSTGGEAFFPGRIDEVVATCERIASDIRHQYTIGYVSGRRTETGGFRSLRVVARSAGKNLEVRTRPGFVANADSK